MKGVKFFTYFAVLGLCLLTGACNSGLVDVHIDIGDYETHLEAWNSQNMLDYQIMATVTISSIGIKRAYITVRNGIPESSDPSYWLEESRMSTIPEFYSFIKNTEETMKDGHNNESNGWLSLWAEYNTKYHYPKRIDMQRNSFIEWWNIVVMPLEEGELDIDIGDYEHHWEAWNNQNMLDYTILTRKAYGYYDYDNFVSGTEFIVKNGIPDKPPVSDLRLTEGTVPGIYSFIKEEEERIRNVYNGINRSYLRVKYHPVYHYPIEIRSGVDHRFGSYEYWDIMLTPEETE